VERPGQLKRLISPHIRSLVAWEIRECCDNLLSDQELILALRSQDTSQGLHCALSAMDRWRLPVVYGKMLKSQFVSNRDAAIWRTVSKNLEDKDVMGVFKRALEPRRAQSAMRTRRPLRGVSGPLKVAPLCINPSPCTRKCVLNPLYTMCIKPSTSTRCVLNPLPLHVY